jgi:hypothetical protein
VKYFIGFVLFIFIILNMTGVVLAKQPKTKFYDFREQIIDGEIRRPTVIYSNAREKVKFERLLKLKKSFMPELFASGKERVFRQKKLLIR